MNNLRRSLFGALLLAITVSVTAEAQNATPDFWQCSNRISGNWVYGQAPYACDIDPFADPTISRANFSAITFNDAVAGTAERTRYMKELVAVMRDAADFYLLRRRPGATSAERAAWKRAVMAIGHQESVYSHYRLGTDSRLKMMRGDFGHGHGLMQVDDRWHFLAINQGKGAQMIQNMVYSLEEYFAGWESAARASCVSSPTNYVDRARAAYSAYNGGPTKICRFANPNDVWARNDVAFLEKWNLQAQLAYEESPPRPAAFNVRCYAEGGTDCGGTGTPPPTEPPPPPAPTLDPRFVYKNAQGQFCMSSGAKLQCVEQNADAICLAGSLGRDIAGNANLDPAFASVAQEVLNRHAVCESGIDGLIGVGDMLSFGKDIYLRATPGGEAIRVVPRGTIAQALDFVLQGGAAEARYYRVEIGGRAGYFYAGDRNDYAAWATSAGSSPGASFQASVALVGQSVLTQPTSLNFRATIGGNIITAIPRGTRVVIRERVVRGKENFLYYGIEYRGNLGWIYGGQILPSRDTASWVKVE